MKIGCLFCSETSLALFYILESRNFKTCGDHSGGADTKGGYLCDQCDEGAIEGMPKSSGQADSQRLGDQMMIRNFPNLLVGHVYV